MVRVYRPLAVRHSRMPPVIPKECTGSADSCVTLDLAPENAALRRSCSANRSDILRPMDIELWWPKLSPSTREWLIDNNGDSVPPEIAAEIRRAGGEVSLDSESEQSGVYLSDDDVDWIETVANEEEPS
jgi:hypothetical protein